jgi:transposase
MALQEGLAEIVRLDETIERWEEQIAKICEGLPEARMLAREIPGVGKVLSATILGETGSVQRFTSAGALGRYTGLTPSDRSTGGAQIHGGITHEGSRYLRWALVQAVVHCLRGRENPELAIGDWVRARSRRLGGPKARSAAARKLAECIWRLFNWGEAFDVTKPFGGRAVEDPARRASLGLA